MGDRLSAIGCQLSVAYLPTIWEPLLRQLKDLVVQLVPFEMHKRARVECEPRGGSAIPYGAAGTGSPLHGSVRQTVALPEDVDVSSNTRLVFPLSTLRISFSEAGLMPAVNIWRRLRREIFNSCRPEFRYMRGPDPRWREKHAQSSSVLPISRHR